MIKDELKKSEPIAYQILENALKNNKVAHSYLLSGEYSALKVETAYLIAQSIIENKNDFACETCDTCRRIRENQYYDVIYVDGYKESIKKQMVENILDEFSKTSLEAAGKKIYILANINNSSAKVLNMILKFMEEPSNDNTYGIFISDNKASLLPTIVSRCQDIPFMTRDFSSLASKYEDGGFSQIDAYILANILHQYDPEFDLNDEYYLTAKDYVYQTLDNLENSSYLPVLFYKEFYPSFKERNDFRICSDYYLDIMIKMIEDAISDIKTDDDEYNKYLDIINNHNPIELLKIFQKAKEKVDINAERKLLFDAICHEIISYT